MDLIYLDNNASTPLLPEAWEAMRPYFLERSGNAASSHHAGRQARQALEDARERIADLLGAHPDELLFTSGATEANNLALFGLSGDPPASVAISAVEHPCVSEPARVLAQRGFTLATLPVDSLGVVQVEPGWPPPDLRLVSIQLANHETGAIQPVAELVERCRQKSVAIQFHCDAAAAAGKIPIAFHKLGVTALTISAHKFHGPKGIGALLLKKQTRLHPQIWGGHQQQGKRPGTEPVPLAVGMACALEWCVKELDKNRAGVLQLRRPFIDALQAQVNPIVVNGPQEGGIPYTANLSFPGCRADLLLMKLDLAGVACSTGSACSSGSLLASPVLVAMAIPHENLHSALRFSFSALLTPEAVAEAARRIAQAVKELRQVIS